MSCPNFDACDLWKHYTHKISDEHYNFLVQSFCATDNYLNCKRFKWKNEKNEEPPFDMLPNGFFILGMSKEYQ